MATMGGLAVAGCSGDSSEATNGSSDDSDDENNSDRKNGDVIATWNYKEYDKVRFPSQESYFESDNETQYVGVQLKATNETDESLSLVLDNSSISLPELGLFVDDSNDSVPIHARSKIPPLENVEAGATVETTLLYTPSPGASNYTLRAKEIAEHTYDISMNTDLEVGLVQVRDS
jgi:hypothetical protein